MPVKVCSNSLMKWEIKVIWNLQGRAGQSEERPSVGWLDGASVTRELTPFASGYKHHKRFERQTCFARFGLPGPLKEVQDTSQIAIIVTTPCTTAVRKDCGVCPAGFAGSRFTFSSSRICGFKRCSGAVKYKILSC